MSINILKHNDQPAFVVLSIDEYERLLDAAEDAGDIAALDEFHRALIRGEEETFPDELTERLLDGENPVRLFRTHRGLTLQALADACGVTNSHISQIEKGKRSMSTDVLKKMARALRVDVELLL